MWRRLARSSAIAARYPSTARPVGVSRLQTCLQVSQPCPQHLVVSSRAFVSSPNTRYESRANDIRVRDVALCELVQRPWVELQEYYGPGEMSKIRQALPMLWKELSNGAKGSVPVALEIVKDFYEAARRCRLPKLQQDAFSYMETHFLRQITFEMYGQMFTNLTKEKDPQRMRAIFERSMTRYDPEQGQIPPEIVYRLGIGAAIALDDYAGVKTLMREMEANGVRPSIEIVTRVMVAQAKKGDTKTVLEAAVKLNPQGEMRWHEADVNRVVTSLGIAGDPDAAFDFYRRSQIRLSSNTMMKLMLVCRGNSRPKQALAILANRRRFGLKMLPAQYAALLEIIEELDIGGAPTNEMALVLKEMRANGVSFNDRVHALIARNQQHLHGTPFMLTPSLLEHNDERAEEESGSQSRTKEADMPLLRELLDSRKFAHAAAIVDGYALPVSDDMKSSDGQHKWSFPSEEAIIVPPWLADMAVEAYSQNQEVDKVRSLLCGFLCVRGDFKHALSRVVGLYGGNGRLRDNHMAYKAFVAMQFQGLQIFRVRDALTRFKHNQDSKAALLLLTQVSEQIAGALKDTNSLEIAAGHQEDFMRVLDRSRTLNFDPRRTVRDILRMLLESREVDMAVAALDTLESDGIPVRSVDYENIFGAMAKATSKDGEVYTAEDFMKVWEDMLQRSVAPSKAILRLVIPVLCGEGDDDCWKRRHLAVINGYRQAAKDRRDAYVLPIDRFSTLLQVAAKTGTIEDVNAIYAGAVKSLGATVNKKRRGPGDHSKILEAWDAIKAELVTG